MRDCGATGYSGRLPIRSISDCFSVPMAGTETEGETETLNGHFVWNNRGTKGDLEAVFSATGEGQWDVAFHFSFRGKPHVHVWVHVADTHEVPLNSFQNSVGV